MAKPTALAVLISVIALGASFALAQKPARKSAPKPKQVILEIEDFQREVSAEIVQAHPNWATPDYMEAIYGHPGYPRLEATEAGEPFRKPFIDCSKPKPIAELCEAKSQACAKSGHCVADWGDGAKLAPELRAKMLAHLARTFSGAVKSREMQRRCCGSDSRCVEAFSSIRFQVVRNSRSRDYFAQYDPSSNTVQVREEVIYGQPAEEMNESWLYHELGHACEQARGTGAEQDPRSACLMRGLEKLRRARRLKTIPREWVTEAYPQIVFNPAFTSVFQWHSACGPDAHERYFMDCMAEDPAFKKRWCR